MIDQDILELDLDAIAFKLCLDEKMTLRQVDDAVWKYRCLLHLFRHAEPGESVAPCRTSDTVWHHHILDTQKYHQDCERLFGRYIHHFPYSGIFEGEDEEAQRRRHETTREKLKPLLQDKGMHP